MTDSKVAAAFSRLFAPFHVGSTALRNRIVFPPMVTGYASPAGQVTERLIQYYSERSRGGAGLIVVETTAVEVDGRGAPTELRLHTDAHLEGFERLAAAIHEGGASAAVQLVHSGGIVLGSNYEGVPTPAGPSAFQIPMPGAPLTREMTVDEIKRLVASFAAAAARAELAGFDGAELHAAHGYLLSQFLSPLSNSRQDHYGGDVARRARLVIEIIRAIKACTGKEFFLGCRVSGDEFAEGGITLDDTVETAKLLEQAGANYISVSGGSWFSKTPYAMPPIYLRNGYMVYLADRIKQSVGIPVITAGRINTPSLADDILREGRADLVAMGRALIADPELPNKARQGRVFEIRPCIACNLGCFDRVVFNVQDLKCSVNPTVGRPELAIMEPAREPKNIAVIGGGPAGMIAATIAARRGHRVTLLERRDTPGGQVLLAALPPGKEEFVSIVDYLWRDALSAGVDVRLGKRADVAAVRDLQPDVVVLATGSKPEVPDIPGIKGTNVVTAPLALYNRAQGVGSKVAVLGGGEVGCETAAYLASLGKQVTVLRRGAKMADDMGVLARSMLMKNLRDGGVEMITGVTYEQVDDGGIAITLKGTRRKVECDTIVLAAGSTPNDELAASLSSLGYNIVRVGETIKVGNVLDAVEDAWITAREV